MNVGSPKKSNSRAVALIGFEGAAALDITGPHEVFSTANHLSGDKNDPPYRLLLLADKPGAFRTASGLNLVADASWRGFEGDLDTVIMVGGPDVSHKQADKELLAWLSARTSQTRRMASVCTGALVLAEAGILDGRRATTHWQEAERLKQTYPKVMVQPDAIYVKDGSIYTSAGVSAGMDLALALVEEDLGRAAALAVARMLVLFLKRPGGQSQFSTMLQAQGTEGKRVASLLSWLVENYRKQVGVEEMASHAGMTPRTFARVFLAETGVTPARYVEKLRMEHAIRLLETTHISVEAAARECGFHGCEQLRRAFLRHLGVTPHDYQRRFQSTRAETKGDLCNGIQDSVLSL